MIGFEIFRCQAKIQFPLAGVEIWLEARHEWQMISDWRILLTAFTTVFIAELGDKTQLATLSLAAGGRGSKLAVFVGSALALVCTSAIGVLAGGAVARYVSPTTLRRVAGVVFVVLGVLYLWPRTGTE